MTTFLRLPRRHGGHPVTVTLLGTLGTVLVAVLMLASPASARSTDRCGLNRASTVKQAGTVKVLKTRSGKVYSCFARTGKRKLIADVSSEPGGDGESVQRFVIAGRYIAYAHYVFYTDVGYYVDLVDARRGRITSRLAGPVETLGTYADAVSQVDLTTDGVVAWIYQNPYTNPIRTEVHRRIGTRDDILASGQTIDASLLIVSDGLVIWRQDGQLQSARVHG